MATIFWPNLRFAWGLVSQVTPELPEGYSDVTQPEFQEAEEVHEFSTGQ